MLFWNDNPNSIHGNVKVKVNMVVSGQISIIPKPEIKGILGKFPYFSPPFLGDLD